ncbi:flagellar hook protein FlgE [Aureimonas phyllosphaerae]|uniref:Flagellar hook protein FlgE n=1 Tax=Aureimonas phyllosphaerae TaxID=1166078 RepID=A0A7W6BVM7_9HYPH|nr:flagellar hook protein FlgE [Aureimonas phyllosphaerae]MBB3935560.1 flagellar hook protein FlgE [Aureimonas phyllosphaerae]MBB3959568.1 flagellar hook protein FlgE [Aureimonas phyllosphaerae]SFF12273.1 flagellar hook protein FlgE [Aureimonas phyllosphaerae]
MSIGGLMRTSVSGMNAQATRLSAVSENIANANTNGYKQTTTEFTSQMLANGKGQYNSGAVEANVRTLISEQGGLSYTANSVNSKKLDLAISGQGFLVVDDGNGGNVLTRAGSFMQQPDGTLVNAAGYALKGYPVGATGTDFVLNGFAGLKPVNLNAGLLSASPSTKGILTIPLNKDFTEQTGDLPSANTDKTPDPKKTVSNSLVVYTNSGEAVKLDIYYTKTSDANNEWEVTVFDSRGASKTGTNRPFPYDDGPLKTATLAFDATKNYSLASIDGTATGILDIDLSSIGGVAAFNLDIGNTTQFTGDNQPLEAKVDGNPAEVIDKVNVGKDGTVLATFTSGATRELYKIPLAKVAAPDNMTVLSGNAFAPSLESGSVLMGFGGSDGFGDLISGALENSTVDMASELTTMIESQRSYTANSKVFQTGSEIMDVLVNLKR